jgi:hypothetical protein
MKKQTTLICALLLAMFAISACDKETPIQTEPPIEVDYDDGLNGSGNAWHVTTNGTPQGNGTISAPWDLQTALNQPDSVKGGDIIWLHQGTYIGVFENNLVGLPEKPIIVRAALDEEVILNGDYIEAEAVLTFLGAYTWIADITIECPQNSRYENSVNGKDGVYFLGNNNKLINCIIRNNGGNGVGFWSTATNSEIYGCIIYNNGYIGSDRGHGHGIYTQNLVGTKRIADNILFNSFGIGIQMYTEQGNIQGYEIEGNTIFNSGLPGASQMERNIICGGLQPIDRVTIKGNCLYFTPNYPAKAGVQFGYSADNLNASFIDNYMTDGTFYIISKWKNIIATGNMIAAHSSDITLVASTNLADVSTLTMNNNKYYNGRFATNYPNLLDFTDWKSQSYQDAVSQWHSGLPTKTEVFVRPNRYVKGRAYITAYNWSNVSSISVNGASILSAGDKYEVYDVSNLAAGAISQGTYSGGSISIPINQQNVELPAGWSGSTERFKPTAPNFGVFILQRIK